VLTAWQANELSDYAHIWRATDPREVEHHDAVLLVRHPHRRVHLVGVGELGEHLRPLLRGGVEGWRLHELPVTLTPLNDAEPLLGPRVYAILARFGFATVEEIAAVPDLGLLDIRHFGPKTRLDIRTTRHATGAAGRRGGARPVLEHQHGAHGCVAPAFEGILRGCSIIVRPGVSAGYSAVGDLHRGTVRGTK